MSNIYVLEGCALYSAKCSLVLFCDVLDMDGASNYSN